MRDWSQEHWQRVDRLFVAALERSPGERAALLDTADDAVRREVVELLEAAEAAGGLLDTPAHAVTTLLNDLVLAVDTGAPLGAGRTVGPYRIVELVGQGGMGAVYRAERDDVQMQVALKLVRGELAAPHRTERFLRERRLLAQLEHPNIARLLDAGLTSDGAPYLVMEHVEGEPITAYCDRRRLTVEQRLDLFMAVCEAVRYAHQRLVVHRDLKPSNILVTEDGTVKLLDFGIARRLDEEDGLTPDPTRPMTPEYAAPEQVLDEPVTTASDAYSLGVLLYELLAGRRPYDLAGLSPREKDAAILTARPVPPSQVAYDLASEASPEARPAYLRGSTTEHLRRHLQGDLDAIVLKALRKEADRRYPSAEALLDDLRRYREGRPVEARPDSRAYRAAKFVGRHRAGVAGAVALVVLLVAFSLVTVLQAREVARQRDAAVYQLDKAREATVFLAEIFGRAVSPADSAAFIEQVEALDLPDEPAVQAEVQNALDKAFGRQAKAPRPAK